MKKTAAWVLILALAIPLAACAQTAAEEIAIAAIAFPEACAAGEAVPADAEIVFSGQSAAVYGGGARAEDGCVTITDAGAYLLSGDFTGTLVIDVAEEAKTVLYLNGVCIRGDAGAAVWVKREPKNVTFYTCKGSVNLLEDAQTYAYAEGLEDAPTAALYSKEDLKFDGEGALYVRSHANKGIQSKDDIEILSGQIYVIAGDDGIRGKDSVCVSGGEIRIEAGADGLRATNETDEGKGYIQIDGGEIYITAAQDGIQAYLSVCVTGGQTAICAGGGSANSSTGATESAWGSWGGRGPGGRESRNTAQTTADTASAKGIKADASILISGGRVSVNSSDDALHTNGDMRVTGGAAYLSSGDDGMHADKTLTISGGEILISKSYEGIEAEDIRISGGVTRVTASDDGLNAAGGADASSVSGRAGQNWGRGMMDNGVGSIAITGGYLAVNASGDGLDSNGSASMSGGTAIVYGPTNNGNGALDYGGTFSFSGGTLLAVGASGMAQSVTGSGAGVLAFTINMNANELLTITGADGGEIIAFEAPKSYACVILASDKLSSGASYNVYSGGARAGESTDGVYAAGSTENAEKLGSLSAN